MSQIYILILATILYAGYNLLIKVSGDHVPSTASTTIAVTFVLQFAALCTSAVFASILVMRGTDVLGLTPRAYLWAVCAGICIGGAEIAYLYLFGGIGISGEKLPANVVIPFVVSGTILITLIVSVVMFQEAFGWPQMVGSFLIVLGMVFLFADTWNSAAPAP